METVAHAEISGSGYQIQSALNGEQRPQLQLPNHHDDKMQPQHTSCFRLPRWFLHRLSAEWCFVYNGTQKPMNLCCIRTERLSSGPPPPSAGCSSAVIPVGTAHLTAQQEHEGNHAAQGLWWRFGMWCIFIAIISNTSIRREICK